jgi:Leucine-rich repeat (LRR) protein
MIFCLLKLDVILISRLEELHLNNNAVSLVQHSIGQLVSLHTLSLADNRIERLVADIGMRLLS